MDDANARIPDRITATRVGGSTPTRARGTRRWWRGPLISLGTVAVLLVVLEVAVRVFVPAALLQPFANVYAPDPTPGVVYTLKPGYRGFAIGNELAINRLGFRGPDRDEAKPPGVFRIALIGDSHAFGYGVPYEATVGRRVEELLGERQGVRCEVLNFGVAGYNARQQEAVFRGCALRFAPDLVVVMPCTNDHEPPLMVDGGGWLRFGRTAPGTDPRMEDRLATWQEVAFFRHTRGLLGASRLYRLVHYLLLRHRMRERSVDAKPRAAASAAPAGEWMGELPPGPFPDALREPVYEPLATIAMACRRQGVPVVFAPYAVSSDWRRLFRALGDEHGAPVLELLGLFPEARDYEDLQAKFGLSWDAHLGPEAHDRWARALCDLIEELGYIR